MRVEVEQTSVNVNDTIIISCDQTPDSNTVDETTVRLYYKDYPLPPSYDCRVSGNNIEVIPVEPWLAGYTIILTVVGERYGVKSIEGEALEEPVYTFAIAVLPAEEPGTAPSYEHALIVTATIPEDYYTNYTDNHIKFFFNVPIDPSIEDAYEEHVFIHIKPVIVLPPNSRLPVPPQGYLAPEAYSVDVDGTTMTITIGVPIYNAEINVKIVDIHALDISYVPISSYEIVFTYRYSPLLYTPDYFEVDLPDDVIYRYILRAEAIADTLYPGILDWNDPEWCVVMFVYYMTQRLILERLYGILAIMGGSFSKRLGDLQISYNIRPDNDLNKLLGPLSALVRNRCAKVALHGVIPGRFVYPIPYHRPDIAWRRFPILKDYFIEEPTVFMGDRAWDYGVFFRKHMDQLETGREVLGEENV